MATTKRAAVIGSGAGGLAAAGYLAREGFDVRVFEHAHQFGGYLAPFYREGYQFCPGVHVLPQARPGQPLYETLAGLGLDPAALLCELEPEGFEVYRFPGLEVRMCRGLDAYRLRLAQLFPRAAAGIERYFETVKDLQRVVRAAQAAAEGSLGPEQLRALGAVPAALRWGMASFDTLLRAMIPDEPQARAVLAAAGGDYGLPPSRASAWYGAGVLGAYGDGGFYPRGGGAALRDALVRAAEQHGAVFRAGARVTRILTDPFGRAAGVELSGAERFEADVVVSDADPTRTFGELLDPAVVPARLREKVARTEPSIATFAVYLGMRRDVAEHGLGRFNVWDYPDWDIEALYGHVRNGRLPPQPALYLSPSSLKDDAHATAPPGRSALEVVTFVPYEMFRKWHELPAGARGPEYEAEKRRVGDWILEAVERRWPGLLGDVDVQEMSTPLTNESYVLAVQGGAYGPALTPSQSGFRRFRTASPVPNLFLAGAGVLGDGVVPCLLSGRIAARAAARALGVTGARPHGWMRRHPAPA